MPEAEANFAHAIVRPLDAEVLVDAVCQITGTSEQYSSAIPEPFTFIPPDQRSIALADGSIRSTFLETFGRPPRDTGLLSERNSKPSASQRLYLLNSGDVQRKLQQGPKLQALLQTTGNPRQLVTALYLAILSRFPTEEEVKTATGHANGARRQQAPGRVGYRVGAAQQRGVSISALNGFRLGRLAGPAGRFCLTRAWHHRRST